MKLIILAVLVACASAASIFDATLDSHWVNYKIVHQKSYGSEEIVRRLIWEANLKYINQHNEEAAAGEHTFTVAMNKYGDMTSEEFGAMYNRFNATKVMQAQGKGVAFVKSGVKVPANVDWRKEGYVTPVKDQGQCGSCWAFSTVASLEGQHFKKEGKLVSLSEQNLVDCSRAEGNQGCNGGLMDQGFDYIKKHGIDTEASYPYKAVDGRCRFEKENVGATLTSYTDVESGDEDALVEAIAKNGPISVAIDASHSSFQLYSEGIYNERRCSSYQLDHGVTAVGYGTNQDGDFYIVKNSWAEAWGMKGYIMMSRNKDNQCGIATQASFPIV
jgi:cathepsin L